MNHFSVWFVIIAENLNGICMFMFQVRFIGTFSFSSGDDGTILEVVVFAFLGAVCLFSSFYLNPSDI